MTRESREPTTNETLQSQLESAYETARTKLESAYEEARAKLESALERLQSELDSRRGPSAGSRDATGTEVTVEREPAAGRERGVGEPSTPDSADEPPATPPSDEPPATPGEPADEPPAPSADATETPSAGGSVVDDAVEASAPEGSDEPVESLSGIGPAYAERLSEAGVDTVGDLAAADAASLAEATGVGEGRLSSWIEQAKGE